MSSFFWKCDDYGECFWSLVIEDLSLKGWGFVMGLLVLVLLRECLFSKVGVGVVVE